MKLMVFTTDDELRAIKSQLSEYSLIEAQSSQEVVEKVLNGDKPDILIIDQTRGHDVLQRLESEQVEMPIIIRSECLINNIDKEPNRYYMRNIIMTQRCVKHSGKLLRYLVEELEKHLGKVG